MKPEASSRKLVEVLAQYPAIRFAYLFGSEARETATPASDVDVAIEVAPGERIPRLWLEVSGALARALAPREVDCILLNAAPPALRFEVIREGRLLLDREPEARRAFEVGTRREYWDLEPSRRRFDEALRQRLRDGTYGTQPGNARTLAPS